jgi:hypothetical protein
MDIFIWIIKNLTVNVETLKYLSKKLDNLFDIQSDAYYSFLNFMSYLIIKTA